MSRATAFTIVLNNPDEKKDQWINEMKPWIVYYAHTREVGKSGTPHFQGYIQTKHQMTLSALKAKIGSAWHIDISRGTDEENETYLSKTDGERFEMGTRRLHAGRPACKGGSWMKQFIEFIREDGGFENYYFDFCHGVEDVYRRDAWDRCGGEEPDDLTRERDIITFKQWVQIQADRYFEEKDVVLSKARREDCVAYMSVFYNIFQINYQ